MPTCRRCGDPFERMTVAQVRCQRCDRELAVRPAPCWLPAWRERSLAKDMTGVR